MGDKSGSFVWRELITSDVDASARFYGELFGWKIEDARRPGMPYRLVFTDGKRIAGMMPVSPGDGIAPHWMSYVASEDVDAAAARAVEAGGVVCVPATDIPDVGRFAVLQDPQGATVTVYKRQGAEPPSERPGLWEFCWEQLNTSAPKEAPAFYEKVFGWTAETNDTGLSVFRTKTAQVATLMRTRPGVPSHWLTYVAVAKLAEVRSRATRLGGKVYVDEIPVPGMGRIAILGDNIGATLGVFEADL